MNSGNLSIVKQDTPGDDSLIADLKQHDINAPVKELYNQYFDLLVTFLQTRGASKDDATDLFQETILVLIDMIRTDRYRGESPIKAYMFGIAKNLWLEEIRSRGRRNRRQRNFQASEPQTTGIESRLFSKEISEIWSKLIGSLGGICSKILQGFYYEKLSMRELLSQVDFASEQALRNRKSKCMKSLKETISKYPDLIQKLQQQETHGA